MNYEVYINKQPYKVSRKVYICHCTGEIKKLQPDSFYTQFILNYKYKGVRDTLDFFSMYLGDAYVERRFLSCYYLVNKCRTCILALGNLADFMIKHKINDYLNSNDSKFYFNEFINGVYNYPNLEFNTEYKLLCPWIQFYHSLIHTIGEDDLVKKRTVIYPKDINTVINSLGYTFSYKDIKEDLLKHNALVEIEEDVLVWLDTVFADWLFTTPQNRIYTCNYYKLISKIKLF